MKFPLLLAMAAVAVTSLRADAPPAPAKPAMSLDIWNATLPFSFKYDGKDASTFLSTWQKSEEPATPSEGGQTHHYVFTDPATKLKVTADVRTFTDFAAVDWVLHFTNSGSADTPILEDVQPLAWDAPEKCNDPVLVTHYGNAGGESLTAGERGFGTKQPMKFSSAYGYSSHGTLPYFNLCDANYNGQFAAKGPGGIMFVIGWTGNWTSILTWDREDKTMNLRAGMNATHLLLHPGESIRTPRIVMLPWQGDYIESNNLWRRLVLGFYSPKDSTGHPVTMPVALFTGPETIDAKLAAVQALHDKKIPVDLYLASGWAKVRGTWTPDPAAYPNGLKPLGDALKQAGIGFALAAEPESADPGSDLLTQHPDWFFPTAKPKTPALLNLGNPAARKAITELISGLITSSGATWYHHDLSQQPQESWAAGDTPDRVGISQINYITGLYQFWDDLRARHPGLIIDSTANGGNRLDIEAISRTTGLWRSDPYEPFVEQIETQELTPWVPLNSGNLGGINPEITPGIAAQLYTIRSTYGPGWTLTAKLPSDDLMRQAVGEFHDVRPFFQGDFYPLSAYSRKPDSWTVWQMHRPDLKAGVAIVLRREKSPFTSVQPGFHAIDPAAQYDVEIRTGFDKGPVKTMSGLDFAKLQIPVADQPGSVLVFYKQR